MGPSALRYAGLAEALVDLGHTVEDAGNLYVPGPEAVDAGHPRARFLPQIVSTCTKLAERVGEVMAQGRFPLVIGGDHSLAVGTVAGVRKHRPDIGVIWLDAHGDFNTPETSPSGNVHGMPLAALVGLGAREMIGVAPSPPIAPERVVMVGVRDLDDGERRLIRETGVLVFTMQEVDRLGLTAVMEKAITHLRRQTEFVHISLDMDVFEPDLAPGVGTPVAGGLTYREGHLALEMLSETGMLTSMEIVEVNPILDVANRTAELAVDMARSALGARVL